MSKPNCKLLEGCKFFSNELEHMPAFADKIKEQICLGDFSECARLAVVNILGDRKYVPNDLFPNQISKVKFIVAEIVKREEP
ncbi:MAG: hypothetical protein OEY01_02490 [Desulfobulbaceae bacterium]|nr:hypothetical protein [Desulfobulbaceae bacterium]HIJ78159.1 hypothetical protein [Deltaproteobacteria bacterium]